jgi:hypothetical protein
VFESACASIEPLAFPALTDRPERGEWDASDRARPGDLVRTTTVPRMSQLRRSSFAGDPRVNDALRHAAFDLIESRWNKDGVPRLRGGPLFQSIRSASAG